MSIELLEKFIFHYVQLHLKESVFSWQGGEPTLCNGFLNFL